MIQFLNLSSDLKKKLREHCRAQNVAITSAIIIMIVRELHEHSLTSGEVVGCREGVPSLGFVLRQ